MLPRFKSSFIRGLAAATQAQIGSRTHPSRYRRQSWAARTFSPSRRFPCVCLLPHSPHYSSLLPSLSLPSFSSTASEREAAPFGAAVFCFATAPVQVLAPPASRAPSKKADLGTREQPHARALRVVCLERLRASKGEVMFIYVKWNSLGSGLLASGLAIKACRPAPWPLPERIPATP